MRNVPSVDSRLTAIYRDAVETLADFPLPEDEAVLTFDDAAHDAFWGFAESIETRQRPDGDLYDMRDWASKLHGLVARLAALLHVGERMEKDWQTDQIDLTTMERAIRLGQYAIYHAKAAFVEMGADVTTTRARRILDWIRRSNRGEFLRREVQMYLPTVFLRAEDLDAPLRLLVERGYIRLIQPPVKQGPGRKGGGRYEVNPKVFTESMKPTITQVNMDELEDRLHDGRVAEGSEKQSSEGEAAA